MATVFRVLGDPERDRPSDGDASYGVGSAPVDAWREYDVEHPDPPYFAFDTLSARHPDLYDRFALSSDGHMQELQKLVDLTDMVVCDVGAGTGRSARAAAAIARQVIAVDRYEAVARFGEDRTREAGIRNVIYKVADRAHLPLDDSSVDAVIACMAGLDEEEAFRVVRSGGWIVKMTTPMPEAACGELTRTLTKANPVLRRLIPEPAPDEWFESNYPASDIAEPVPDEHANRVLGGVRHTHDFTYTGEYGSREELAALVGRIYGPAAADYVRERRRSSLSWRLRIEYVQVA